MSILESLQAGDQSLPAGILLVPLCFSIAYLGVALFGPYGVRLVGRLNSVITIHRAFLLGTAMAVLTPPVANAQVFSGNRKRQSEKLPWLEASEYPPPRSLVRAKVPQIGTEERPAEAALMTPLDKQRVGTVDAARLPDRPSPLFPRATSPAPRQEGSSARSSSAGNDPHRIERLHAVLRHPAGKDTPPKKTHHTVMPGDTLWDIAGEVLQTRDIRRIARYWPLIHKENRDVIGADPSLIRPGQVLTLPRI